MAAAKTESFQKLPLVERSAKITKFPNRLGIWYALARGKRFP